MAYKGKFTPKNIHKYQGDHTKIIYRSLWERKFMVFCDGNRNVLEWSSEEIAIPYISPIDGKIHRYYVDFWIKIKTKNNIEEYLIEIKPYKECINPNINNKTNLSKKELKEITKWEVNKQKWKYANNFAKENNIKFKILTEHHLGIK